MLKCVIHGNSYEVSYCVLQFGFQGGNVFITERNDDFHKPCGKCCYTLTRLFYLLMKDDQSPLLKYNNKISRLICELLQ